ncbi:hypothetical protein ABZZ04_05320 [Streptomyces sp. NPDC006435]|uniref:hypothetical protein n=1 Tax=Streptomyces sp. NPDC006435 TaxID=3154300 RepID=UPI0033B816BD
MNDVHDLLARVAENAGQPVISTRAVYAGAARARLRRRVAVSATALAAVAVGAVALPGLAPGAKPQESSVAAPTELAGNKGRADRLVKLLPKDVGSVEQVSLAVVIKHATVEQAEEHPVGPLDGQYAVRRDGGVGYLTINTMDAKSVKRKLGGFEPSADLCKPTNGEPRPTECAREELPDGRVLTIWSDANDNIDGGTPDWGPELTARLTLPDGSLLAVRDSTGFVSDRSQGPLLKSTPLTRAQLRTLMLSPELRIKK